MSMIAVFIGRLFIAVIFVVSGINKLIHVTDTGAMMSAAGVPGWLAIPTGLFELIAAACIALGIYARLFSLLLAGFVLLTILFFHRDFTDPSKTRNIRARISSVTRDWRNEDGPVIRVKAGNVSWRVDGLMQFHPVAH